jgi:hypothetical protein
MKLSIITAAAQPRQAGDVDIMVENKNRFQ